MNISETPKVKFYYGDNNPLLNGEGAQIPVFIGYSGNSTPSEGLLKFKNYTGAIKETSLGGIGPETDNNLLLKTIKEFFTEVKKIDLEDTTVPYVYAIDLGACPSTDGARSINASAWTDAIALAKTALDAQVEVYVGFKQEDTAEKIIPIMTSAVEADVEDRKKGNPRDLYFTVHDATDEQLMDYTDDDKAHYIQASSVGLCEPSDFGKIVARICCTQAAIEPGYHEFRTINPGTYNKRTADECDTLQNAGIIFINDEQAGSNVITRINFAVSTAFAANEKPNDCLFHHRRNVNQVAREVYVVLFKQLKANETQTNIAYLRTDVNNIIKEKINDEKTLMKGSEVIVTESDTNPYTLSAYGSIIPVNSTALIKFEMFIEEPNAIGGE